MRLVRGALGVLVLAGLVTGVWATLLPHAFYSAFPGFGQSWVAPDGPYNLHLVRDVGAAYLMMGALAATALWRPAWAPPATVGGVTLVFNAPHLVYHLTHAAMYPPLDRVLSLAALAAVTLCSLLLVLVRPPVRP